MGGSNTSSPELILTGLLLTQASQLFLPLHFSLLKFCRFCLPHSLRPVSPPHSFYHCLNSNPIFVGPLCLVYIFLVHFEFWLFLSVETSGSFISCVSLACDTRLGFCIIVAIYNPVGEAIQTCWDSNWHVNVTANRSEIRRVAFRKFGLWTLTP